LIPEIILLDEVGHKVCHVYPAGFSGIEDGAAGWGAMEGIGGDLCFVNQG
jgi:hypothetical protein